MPAPAEVAALIARLETLTGPDREVDAAVALAVGWTYEFNAEEDYECWRDPDGKARYLPRYTASLDAVLALAERQGVSAAYLLNVTLAGFKPWPEVTPLDAIARYALGRLLRAYRNKGSEARG